MNESIKNKLNDLFKSQRFAVIATQGKEYPYTSLVSILVSDDFRKIYFPTSKKTIKYENLSLNSLISILIDNRKNEPGDIKNATAVTAIGKSFETKDDNIKNEFLVKHPYMKDFINSKGCVLIEIIIKKYIIVDSLENVNVLDL